MWLSVAGETGDGSPRPLLLMLQGSLWPTPAVLSSSPCRGFQWGYSCHEHPPVQLVLALPTWAEVPGFLSTSRPQTEQLAGPPSLPRRVATCVLPPCFPLALSPIPETHLGSAGPTDVPPPTKPRPLMVGGGAHATQPCQVGRLALQEQTGSLTHRLIPVCPSSAAAGPPPA